MKINQYILGILLAAMTLVSCQEETAKREPSPVYEGNAVNFAAAAVSADINPNKQGYTYDVKLVRSNAEGALTVPVLVEADEESAVIVPDHVTFAAGEAEATLTLDYTKCPLDVACTVVLSIPEANQSPYADGATEMTVSITLALWENAPTRAIIVDGLVDTFFGTGALAWYADYQIKENTDGSVDYRFLNAYSILPSGDDADQFGIYDAYPYNEPGDTDTDNPYHWVWHVSAAGEVSFDYYDMGMDWTYGEFYSQMAAEYFDDPARGCGFVDKDENALVIPASVALIGMGEEYLTYAGDIVIYLDATAYQNAHLSISDFNDETIEWKEIEGETSMYTSEFFNYTGDVVLAKAIDPMSENPSSPYKNLYMLKDVYAKGYGLAFYLDEEGNMSIPSMQKLGISLMGKNLYLVPVDEYCGVETNEVKGTAVDSYYFVLDIVAADGSLVGEFEEVYTYAKEAVVFDKADYLGDWVMTGASQFGEADAEMLVTIAEGEDGTLVLTGIDNAEEVVADYDAESGVMSIGAQKLADFMDYDMTLYTTTLDGDISVEETMDFSLGLNGKINLTSSSECDGYLIRSEAAGGWVDGYYGLSFAPAPEELPAPAKKAIKANNAIRRTDRKEAMSFQTGKHAILRKGKAL